MEVVIHSGKHHVEMTVDELLAFTSELRTAAGPDHGSDLKGRMRGEIELQTRALPSCFCNR